MTDDRRPIVRRPDSLLAEAKRGERGQLKIFLGASPGVGKTYAMLQEAAVRARQGVDVVLGLVETHGRAETQALMAGLEVLPRSASIIATSRTRSSISMRCWLAARTGAHRRTGPHQRRPARATSSAGRTSTRCCDAGIDVVTALNIQHIESLNDIVARITGVRVQETVPGRGRGSAPITSS